MSEVNSNINSVSPSSSSYQTQSTPSSDSKEQNNTSSATTPTTTSSSESELSDKDQQIINMYLNSPYVQAHDLEDEILDNTDKVLQATDISRKISSNTKANQKQANENTEQSLEAAQDPELPEAKYQ